ncbi:unnamed protein product [Gordionus sp. m RMFG-2023]
MDQQNLICDGSWEIVITITDLDITENLRVKGELRIGSIMLMLVDKISIPRDWSDYALWWPQKNTWLLRTKNTLDQYGVQANAHIQFTPIHKFLRIQTPDFKSQTMSINFSIPTYSVVTHVCKDLGLRYPEECSLSRAYDKRYVRTGKARSGNTSRSSLGSTSMSKKKTNATDGADKSFDSNSDRPESLYYNYGTLSTSYGQSLDRKQQESHHTRSNDHNATNNGITGGKMFYTPEHRVTMPVNGLRHCRQQNGTTPDKKISPYYSSDSGLNRHSPRDTKIYDSSKDIPESEFHLIRPKNFYEKARINNSWLNSSLSLMEQGVAETQILLLRFKFYHFFDLNPKLDRYRIDMIYEQAKNAIIFETIDCTDEEAILFAALQLRAQLDSASAISNEHPTSQIDSSTLPPFLENGSNGLGDIDEALDDLRASLEYAATPLVPSSTPSDTCALNNGVNGLIKGRSSDKKDGIDQESRILELGGMLEIRDVLKLFKTHFMVFKDVRIFCYENDESYPTKPPLVVIELKGSEIIPDVNVNHNKFVIKVRVPQAKGITEYWLKCENEDQYAKWMAASRLAANHGKVNDPQIYKAEMSSILAFLNIQNSSNTKNDLNRNNNLTKGSSDMNGCQNGKNTAKNRLSILLTEGLYSKPFSRNSTLARAIRSENIKIEECVPKRIAKKYKTSMINTKIVEAHNTICGLNSLDTKMCYIRTWQALPEYGFTYFTARFMGQKKEELLAITFNRIIKMDIGTGEHIKTWRFTNMKNWSVNWEIKMVILEFENNSNSNSENIEKLCFMCTCADCKTVHEFIGGYVFMSMRSKENNSQVLDDVLFHKLTGGWS